MDSGGEAQQIVNPPQPAAAENNDVWCVNPMIVDYNPGTRTGQEFSKTKREGFLKQTSLRLFLRKLLRCENYLLPRVLPLEGLSHAYL